MSFLRKNNELTKIEKKILNLIEQNEKPIFFRDLVSNFDDFDKKKVISSIKYLVSNNFILELSNNKYVLAYKNGPLLLDQTFFGTISINSKGNGFFKKEKDADASIFIHKSNLNNCLNGDFIKVCLMDKKPFIPNLECGVVLEVLERNRDFFVGTFYKKVDKEKIEYSIIPVDKTILYKIVLDNYLDHELVNGSKVLFEIANIQDEVIYCSKKKILGHVDDVGSDILEIVYDNQINPEFDLEVENEVKQIDFNFNLKEINQRKDLRNLNFITIDPKTSKDMDDAIYVEQIDNGYKLFVAIADVSHYVKINSNLWNAMLERGTSIYLVNGVIPMLPHKLSNDICSLNPFEDRYAMVCEMNINKKGELEYIDVYKSIINSKNKFSYDEVNNYFENNVILENIDNQLYKMIDVAKKLSLILNEKRQNEGYIYFDIKTPIIILDENEKIKDIKVKTTGFAEKMIESFMVCANEATTINFLEKTNSTPFVFRIHDKPEQKKLDSFKVQAKKLGFVIDANINNIQSNTISKWLKINSHNENLNFELVNMILLRTMQKAKYDKNNIGHFGLALKNYTHFTSPIRRICDTIVHHLFKAFILEKQNYSDTDRSYLISNLDYFNEVANKTERNAVEIEREVNSMKFAEYMESKISCEYNGFITHITKFGAFVQLENTIEGLVSLRNFKFDFLEFDEDNMRLVGKRSKREINIGDKLKIRVISSNKYEKKIDFEWVNWL